MNNFTGKRHSEDIVNFGFTTGLLLLLPLTRSVFAGRPLLLKLFDATAGLDELFPLGSTFAGVTAAEDILRPYGCGGYRLVRCVC